MNDSNPQYFLPVVFWINGRVDDYDQDLGDLQALVRRYVKAHLNRKGVGRRFDLNEVDSVVALAFLSLQQMILDQYLPQLHPENPRSVGRVWPWWESTGIKIRVDSGKVGSIPNLPGSDGEAVWQSPEGRSYPYKFYKNATRENRLRWLMNFMRNAASKEAGKAGDAPSGVGPEVEPEDTARPFTEGVVQRDLMRRWREITDSADWDIVQASLEDGRPPATEKERTALARSRRRLRTALTLLERPVSDPIAQRYLARLRTTPDGKRGSILNEYFDRYLKPPAGAAS